MEIEDNQQPSPIYKPLEEDYDYLIYSDGRLFSKKTNKFLVGKIDNVGYRVYALAIGDKLSVSNRKLSKMYYAHRLVAKYFLSNPSNLPYVHHKDENKLNNDVSNLEWVTEKENTQYHKRANKRSSPEYHLNDLEGEKWTIIPENSNYSISSAGRVKNNNTNRILRLDEN